VFDCRRMLTIEKKSIYADTVERALYNGMLSGISLDGKAFFYENPLEINLKTISKTVQPRMLNVIRLPNVKRCFGVRVETVTSHILTPYPGTQLYDKFVIDGRITDFDYSKYNTANVVFKPKNMTVKELYDGYIWIYKQIYSTRNILKRIPKARSQVVGYLLFNFFYRKFGKLTDKLCRFASYERIGKFAEKLSYKMVLDDTI